MGNLILGSSLEAVAFNESKRIPRGWRLIAREVLLRKTLLLAARKELALRGVEHPFTLATVDVFVEKAQRQLTERALMHLIVGCLLGVAALGTIAVAILHLSGHWSPTVPFHTIGTATTGTAAPSEVTTNQLILALFQKASIGAFYVGAVVFLVSLSRALLHEMVVLYQRRHALRFGRLFIYLHPEDISVEQLQAAFDWNTDYRSAFKDIRADKIVESPTGKILEFGGKVTQAAVDLAKRSQSKQ